LKKTNVRKAKQAIPKETDLPKKERKPGIWAGQVIIKKDFDILPLDFNVEFSDES
jgi:hypothetical protein